MIVVIITKQSDWRQCEWIRRQNGTSKQLSSSYHHHHLHHYHVIITASNDPDAGLQSQSGAKKQLLHSTGLWRQAFLPSSAPHLASSFPFSLFSPSLGPFKSNYGVRRVTSKLPQRVQAEPAAEWFRVHFELKTASLLS